MRPLRVYCDGSVSVDGLGGSWAFVVVDAKGRPQFARNGKLPASGALRPVDVEVEALVAAEWFLDQAGLPAEGYRVFSDSKAAVRQFAVRGKMRSSWQKKNLRKGSRLADCLARIARREMLVGDYRDWEPEDLAALEKEYML